MNTSIDCIPCLLRQTLEAARTFSVQPAVHEEIVRSVLRMTADLDLNHAPPAVAQKIHRQLRVLTGEADPYRAEKDRFNQLTLSLLPDFRRQIEASDDPLASAVRLAIAGNVIDLGVGRAFDDAEVHTDIDAIMEEPFSGDIDAFARAVKEAGNILYLADNCGEIVFDRLLLEHLPVDRVTLAVRGRPILNDAVLEDAYTAGIHEVVNVIDNGTDAPGTLLDDCSPEFQEQFARADLIISKGQGNFETLSDTEKPVFFLFKVKCAVVAAHTALPLGTHVLMQGGSFPIRIEKACAGLCG